MVGCSLLWLLLNGLGFFVESSFLPTADQLDSTIGYKWISSEMHIPEASHKRNKRLIIPRHEVVLRTSNFTKAEDIPTPIPQLQQKSRRKGNRNSKRRGSISGKEDAIKSHKLFTGADRKLKKQSKARKNNPEFIRQGQSPRRLRQHMQHKKKVKQFLQKRIQEQIQQRNPNATPFT
ncbi:uncharacterized protein LOC118197095 [Stegodyphus dumicola]|uniref:uncharacterized protein LOC118197095 n=1 Tax=Stegodyphus dumicola TaxID=202533 RepID=UPI0015A7DAE1|nr:uncharacterized protein LOC118197095 [Stegodyphus dumicola]